MIPRISIKQSVLKKLIERPLYSHVLTCFFCLGFIGSLTNDYYHSLRKNKERQFLRGNIERTRTDLNIKAIQRIHTALAGQNSFKFVVVGDSQRRHKTFEKVLSAALQHNPDFILHTGDLTTGGKYYQYKELIDFVEGYAIPIVFAIGNHDIAHKGSRCFTKMFGPSDFFFDVGAYRFVFVNNNEKKPLDTVTHLPHNYSGYENEPGLSNATLATIEELLEAKTNAFIIMHQPPPIEPFRFHSFTRNADAFFRLMDVYGDKVSRVFCGHIHGYGETHYRGVEYVVTGGAGGELVEGRDEEGIIGKHNYVLVTVADNLVSHKVYFLNDTT